MYEISERDSANDVMLGFCTTKGDKLTGADCDGSGGGEALVLSAEEPGPVLILSDQEFSRV
jgi:hypothetical protein